MAAKLAPPRRQPVRCRRRCWSTGEGVDRTVEAVAGFELEPLRSSVTPGPHVEDSFEDVETLVAAVGFDVASVAGQQAQRADREMLCTDHDSDERIAVATPEKV